MVQVVDEARGEIVYTLRILGTSFRPKVFQPGTYTVIVGEGTQVKTFKEVESLPSDQELTIDVTLD